MAAAVKHWEDEVSARVDQPLAVSARAFDKREVKGLIEQAMRTQTGADFAFMNLGGVRDIVPKGQLLVRNIWNIMPFDNRVVVGKFKGRDLPAVVLGGRQVQPDRYYTLAVTDFTAANQATQENLRTTGLKFPQDAGLLRDVLLDWFRKKKEDRVVSRRQARTAASYCDSDRLELERFVAGGIELHGFRLRLRTA